MASRNEKILTLGRLSALLLLLVLVLTNVVIARSSTRIDLTEEGLHTLSAGSKRVLASLEDPALIKVYWHDVPENAETQRLDLAALLEEMRNASDGKLRVRWVDLDDEDGQQEAQDDGVQKYTFTAQRAGELRAVEGYAGLVVEVGDEKELIHQLVGVGEQMEYELVTRVHRMTTREDTVIGLVANRPASNPFMGAGPQGRFRALEDVLGRGTQASLRATVTLDEPVPPDVDLLVVVAPEDWDEKRAYHLDQYLLRGGRVLLMLDPVHAGPLEAPADQPTKSGLEAWLAHLGIQVESGVVGDFENFLMRARRTQRGRGGEAVNYPYWLLLRRPFMEEENPAVRGFDQVPLYWPAPLSLSPEAVEDGTLVELASSSDRGMVRPDLFGLDRADLRSDAPTSIEELDVVPLVALRKGTMTSFWQGKPIPGDDVPEDEAGDPDAEVAEAEETGDDIEGPERLDEGEGLLIVFTDAELVSDDPLWHAQRLGPAYANGFSLVQNMVEWMSGSDDLLELRAKTRNERRIEAVESKEQKLYTWLNILGVPTLFLLMGIVVFIVRRVQR